MDILQRQLRHLQRAFATQIFFARLAELSLLGALLWLGWAVVRFAMHAPIWNPALVISLIGAEITAAAFWAWQMRPDLAATATKIDQLAGTRDRFSTALAFATADRHFEKRAAAECAEFIAQFDVRPWSRWQLSPRFAALLVPVIVTALLIWLAQPAPLTDEQIAQREAANERAQALETLAQQAKEIDSPVVQKVAAQMRQAAETIQKAPRAEEAEKASLRALSELEAALRQQALAARQAEMDALAKALASQPATKPSAQSLQERNLAAAAEQLSAAAKKLDPKTAQQLAEAIRKAMAQLNRDSALARQMNATPQSSSAAEALQKLAQMLRQQAGERTAEAGSGGRTPTEQELLNALENLKNQSRSPSRQAASLDAKAAEGKSGAPVLQRDFSTAASRSNGTSGQIPSGQPGGDHDSGTTKTPFGSAQKTADAQQQTQLSGVLGPGESLQSLVQSTGGDGTAGRRYRALYDAMAPAAEQSVERENIPSGSRVLIKRYFESIRPAE